MCKCVCIYCYKRNQDVYIGMDEYRYTVHVYGVYINIDKYMNVCILAFVTMCIGHSSDTYRSQ